MSILAVLERRLGGTGNFTRSTLETSMLPVTIAPTAVHADLSEAIRRALETFARVSLGLIFFVAGLNGFIDVLPHPSRPLPERALLFVGALLKSGYFFPMLKGAELVAGAAFLSKRLAPLAVAVVAPVIVNILAFHIFLAPEGVPLALILIVLEAYLAWTYRRLYRLDQSLATAVHPRAAAQ